jgi:hypothetical protein
LRNIRAAEKVTTFPALFFAVVPKLDCPLKKRYFASLFKANSPSSGNVEQAEREQVPVVLANVELVEMMRVAQVPSAASFDKGMDRDDDGRGLVRDEEPRALRLENIALRHQIGVLQRSTTPVFQ